MAVYDQLKKGVCTVKRSKVQSTFITHPIPPVYDARSRILILGSFPSVKSREAAFFYGNRQNRFWTLLSMLLGEEEPTDTEAKKRFLLANGIALWDVIASCEIVGSADSSIRSVTPNDLTPLLQGSRIRAIFTNGQQASTLYRRYLIGQSGLLDIPLPSSSPANAAYSLPRLLEAWRVLLAYLE